MLPLSLRLQGRCYRPSWCLPSFRRVCVPIVVRAVTFEAVAVPGAGAGPAVALAAGFAGGLVPLETVGLAKAAGPGGQWHRHIFRAHAIVMTQSPLPASSRAMHFAISGSMLAQTRSSQPSVGSWMGSGENCCWMKTPQGRDGQDDDGEKSADPRETAEVPAFGAELLRKDRDGGVDRIGVHVGWGLRVLRCLVFRLGRRWRGGWRKASYQGRDPFGVFVGGLPDQDENPEDRRILLRDGAAGRQCFLDGTELLLDDAKGLFVCIGR